MNATDLSFEFYQAADIAVTTNRPYRFHDLVLIPDVLEVELDANERGLLPPTLRLLRGDGRTVLVYREGER